MHPDEIHLNRSPSFRTLVALASISVPICVHPWLKAVCVGQATSSSARGTVMNLASRKITAASA